MNPRQTELSYRRVTVENASSVGLVIIMYDLLVGDLRQAINALETGEIGARSTAIKHAFLVLQQLQGSLNREEGGDGAKHLSNFYTVMRGRLWEAHVKRNSEILHEQIRLLLDVRQAWEQADPTRSSTEAISALTRSSDQPGRIAADEEKTTKGWIA
jgi:flagellar secretion chaperone FliS